MRTRRQTKQQLKPRSPSPIKPKAKAARGQKKQTVASKNKDKPNKRNKKEKTPSPEPSPQVQKNRRGRRKKQERVHDKSDSKQKQVKKHHSLKNQKQDAKDKEKKSQAKKKDKKQKESPKEERRKSERKKKKSRSPSPRKSQSQSKKKKSPAKDAAKDDKDEIKKVVVKGAAPVDQYFDRGKNFHVLVHDGKVYSATLNQSNISHNNNKYYNLQVLQSDSDPNKNYFLTRWGRVGTPGQKSITGPFSVNVAIREYNAKFHEKHVKGQYRQLQLNYGNDQQDNTFAKKDGDQQSKKNPLSDYQQSKLPKPLKDLINLIFDIGMMNQQMKQIGYNVNKMPLGKLSKENIKKGYGILKQLEEEIQHRKRDSEIQRLTNDFYSYIPHDVGFRNMRLYALDTLKKVKDKIEMLQSLSQIKIATEMLNNNKDDGNKIDNNYKKLNREVKPIQKDSFTFKIINDYLQTTHATTHRYYDLELVDLFEVNSEMESKRYLSGIPNKMLLWHGSRLTNFVGILSQGLRIAPPEAPVTGYMFGKGVYFADMSSKSANYCFTNRQSNTGILLLCEVAVGTPNLLRHADYLASNLPDGKHSTKGVGRTAPKESNYQVLDGVTVPMGPGENTDIDGSSLLYNEYIVYKIEQIRIRYLLRVNFNYKN